MPEKPEVITVAKSLKTKILGREIIHCNVYWDNIIAYPTTNEFQKKIVHQKIHDITTRGKFIVMILDDYDLLVHLRMEGKFLFRGKSDEITKHEHVELIFDNGESFRYHDVRKFGKMYLIPKEKIHQMKPLSELGLEFDDTSLTSEYLYDKIHKRNIPIKTVLLDQSIITGIGNIYVDEILYMSHIHPLRKCSLITKKECDRIIQNTRVILNKAIQAGGTTIRSFTSSEGIHGLFQHELLVHGKEGNICSVCGDKIIKIRVGGRGTSYCPKCQI